jgi:hypothetical protein
MANNPNHRDNLKPFALGFDERRNLKGRKEKKWLQQLKDQGYESQQVNDTLNGLIACTEEDLNTIMADPESTMLEKVCCKAVIKAMKNGSFFSMDFILTRIFGKPKETVDQNITANIATPVLVQVIDTGYPLANSEQEVK